MSTFSAVPHISLLIANVQPGEEIISINAYETDEFKLAEDLSLQISAALYNTGKLTLEEINTSEIKALRWGWITKPKQPNPHVYTIGAMPVGRMWVVYTKTLKS